MKKILLITLLAFIFNEAFGNFEKCGTFFTETTGHLKTKNSLPYSHDGMCIWTIIARNHELITLDISANQRSRDIRRLKVSHSIGSASSSTDLEFQDKKLDSNLWIRGGKVELAVKYSPCSNCYDGSEVEFKYSITTLNESKCEEVIQVKTTDVIKLPHQRLSVYDEGSLGCNVLIKLDGNQTLKTILFVDLPDDKPLLLEVYEGNDTNSSLNKSRSSKANLPLNPISNSMLVSFRYSQEHVIIDPSKVFMELNIVNSELDCEFKESVCAWTSNQESSWVVKELKGNESPTNRMEKVASVNLSGKKGSWTKLTSPILTTEEQELCVKIEYRMFGPSTYATILVFTEEDSSRKLWSNFYNKFDGFSVSSFNIPLNLTGSVSFVFIEGEASKNGKFELNYVRSSWGKCELQFDSWEQPGVSWFPDLTGTEMFYKSGNFYKATLPFNRSVARIESGVIKPDHRGYCLTVKYKHSGPATLSIFMKRGSSELVENAKGFGFKKMESNFSIQYAFNQTEGSKVYLEAQNNKSDNVEFELFNAELSPGYCSVNCNFSADTSCAWTFHNASVSFTANYLEMRHEYEAASRNEIQSPLLWDSAENWFCVRFRIGSVPALCISVGVYKGAFKGHEELLMQQCGPTFNYTIQCVPLPEHRALQVYIRTTGEGTLSTDNTIQNIDENIQISSVWTSAQCHGPFSVCTGWSSEGSKAITWNVSPTNTLMARRSCCQMESREKGYVWSSPFKISTSLTHSCLTFSYSFQKEERLYHPTENFHVYNGYGPCNFFFQYGRIRVSGDMIEYLQGNNERKCLPGGHADVRIHPNIQQVSEIQLLVKPNDKVLWKRTESNIGITHNVSITLNAEYQIGFSAILSRSNLQISDLTVAEGKCKSDHVENNFSDNLGRDWSTSSDSFFSWSRVHSSAYNPRNLQTGPYVDCSLSPGGFAVANSSLEGTEAHLISPELKTRTICFSFCYHMFGVSVGELELRLSKEFRSSETKLWSKVGNQGNLWRRVQISVSPNTVQSYIPPSDVQSQQRLHLIARKGEFGERKELGDIAVDSIMIDNTACEKLETIVDIPKP